MNSISRLISSIFVVMLILAGTALAAEKVVFYTTDPAGSPVVITDDKGNVVWRDDYKPFGEDYKITGTLENNERFIGKEKDKETGLVYINHRYYVPGIGRFGSPDPMSPVDPWTSRTNYKMLENPQLLNRYAYGLNNPYKYVDPDGRMPWLLPLLYNLLLPSSANAPESREALTVPSQTTGEFAGGVAAMETGGAIINKTISRIATGSARAALNAGGRELSLSDHALGRMSERGVSLEQAQTVVNNSKPFNYFHNNVWKTGYYDSESKIFLGEYQNKVTTVITNVKPNYIENIKNAAP